MKMCKTGCGGSRDSISINLKERNAKKRNLTPNQARMVKKEIQSSVEVQTFAGEQPGIIKLNDMQLAKAKVKTKQEGSPRSARNPESEYSIGTFNKRESLKQMKAHEG